MQMQSKLRLSLFLALIGFFSADSAWAAPGETEMTGLGLLFGALTFLLALSCFYLAWRVYSFLRRGELALPWQLLSFSFFLLGLAQLLEVAANSGWLPVTSWGASLLRLLALTILAVGLHRTTKILG